MKQYEKELSPMTNDELNKIIDKAESDSIHGRMITAMDLKKEADLWK